MLFTGGLAEGEPERSESSREQRSRPELNTWGAKGARLFGWDEAAGAPGQGRKGFAGKRRSGEGNSRGFSDHPEGFKALKSEAQERWGLKETSEG